MQVFKQIMWLADRYSSHLHPTSSLWLFSFSLQFLWRAKVFNFGQVPYEVSFSIKGLCFWCCVWKLCISKDCENFILEISVLALISGCISYFELILHMIWVKGSKIWCGGAGMWVLSCPGTTCYRLCFLLDLPWCVC